MKKLLALVLVLALALTGVVSAFAEPLTEWHTYETIARELETWNVQYSQAAQDLNVLSNCIDYLLTNNNKGALVHAVAESYTSPDGGKTWVFTLRNDVTWVDYQGNYKADCVAEDLAYGLEWVLNYAKNDCYNTSMPSEMIVGAADYLAYTKTVTEEQGKEAAMALGLEKFYEMVGMKVEGNTVSIECLDIMPYFPSVTCYNCLAPLSGKLIEEIGAEGYKAANFDTIWYNGPYTVTEFVQNSEKVLTKNASWYGLDTNTVFDVVDIKMVDSGDVAFQLFQAGDLDYVALTESNLNSIYNNAGNEFHDYLTEKRPTKYSYQMHLTYEKRNADGTLDTNWNTAVANENFRLALYYGLDLTTYLARTNAINPYSCENYCYTGNAVAVTSAGVDYTQLVRDELGLQYDSTSFNRCDPEKAAAYKAAAIEELTAAGCTLPISMDYYISGSSQTAKDTADVLTQIFKDCLGEDLVVLNTCTFVSSVSKEVRNPQLASFYINGWGADFADPINFLGQEIINDENAYYANAYSKINNATDEKLLATYAEFTDMVNEAKTIIDDLDARYAAFAKAEAYMLEHALVIPMMYEVSWQITSANDYSAVYSAYGNQNTRYVNWETNSDLYTTEDYAQIAAAYNAN